MESPRRAPDPKMAFISKEIPPLIKFEVLSCRKIPLRSHLPRPLIPWNHRGLDPFRQDWPRVVVIFPAEIPSSARFGFHGIQNPARAATESLWRERRLGRPAEQSAWSR